MNEKKKIGQRIWELFLKNYTYRGIAKELGISKSVVSNIINYSLPSSDWCKKNIKKLKEQHEQELEDLENDCVKEKEESINNFILISNALSFIYTIFIVLTTYILTLFNVITSNITLYNNLFTTFIKLTIISIVIATIIFFINKKLLQKLKNEI